MGASDGAECVVCGIGFPAADLVAVDGAPHCPRCFALRAPATLVADEPSPTSGSAGPEPVRARPSDALEAGRDPAGDARGAGWRDFTRSVREWAAGRNWWVRAPVLLWMAWILVQYWSAPWYSTIWRGIDLAFHEIGHILWAPLGEFMGFAGGTLTQLLVPVAAGVALWRQRDWFGVSIAICWLGINCFEIVEYAGDALARRLPLVSPTSGEPEHDWTYMLAELGILHHTDAVAAAWLWAGRITMTLGVAFGGWILLEMWRSGRTSDGASEFSA